MATKAQLEGNKRHQEKLDRMILYFPYIRNYQAEKKK